MERPAADFVSLDYFDCYDKYSSIPEIWDDNELWRMRLQREFGETNNKPDVENRLVYEEKLFAKLVTEADNHEKTYTKNPAYQEALAALQNNTSDNINTIQGHVQNLAIARENAERLGVEKRNKTKRLLDYIRGKTYPFKHVSLTINIPARKLANLITIVEMYQFVDIYEIILFLTRYGYLSQSTPLHHGLFVRFTQTEMPRSYMYRDVILYLFPHPTRPELEYEIKTTTPISYLFDVAMKLLPYDLVNDSDKDTVELRLRLIDYLKSRVEGSQFITLDHGIFYRVLFTDNRIRAKVPYKED